MDAKIFDTLLEPVFILNKEKQVLYCNEAAALIADISARKMVRSKQELNQIFKFFEPVASLDSLTTVVDPTGYQELAFESSSGKTGKVQITIQPVFFESANCWLVFFRDVTLEETLQKKYRKELEQVENYSKNLEKMVEERTAQIQQLNLMMKALLDSLNQGFFIFDKDGLCLEISSKACVETIEGNPQGKNIWDVLKLSEKQVPGFKRWISTVWAEMLPFVDLAALAPQTFPHSKGQRIQLEYYPLQSSEGKMNGVVVVASDITELVQAQEDAERERAHAKMILSLIQQKRQVMSFLQESESLLRELKAEFEGTASKDGLFRVLHTLKGGAASFSIKSMVDQAHQAENLLTEWTGDQSTDIYRNLENTSMLIEQKYQEFLKDNEKILGSREKMKSRWIEFPVEKFKAFQSRLPVNLQDEFAESFLMEPLENFFLQYNEVIQSVADREMKSVKPLKLNLNQIQVYPEIYSQFLSTLIHAFRNAVDHGIETPAVREQAGKSPEGQIEVMAYYAADQLLIDIKDDGGGVDPNKIRERLLKKGIDVSKETDFEVIQHIFDSQFSTKETVTETSGRGVGMDAILHSAKALGGKAWVDSKLGKGTTLKIELPLLKALPGSQTKAA
jgi:two-component system, chemotaxis family, sensor kinase CheA